MVAWDWFGSPTQARTLGRLIVRVPAPSTICWWMMLSMSVVSVERGANLPLEPLLLVKLGLLCSASR